VILSYVYYLWHNLFHVLYVLNYRSKCKMDWIISVWQYIKQDWISNRVRFLAEVFAWTCSVVSALMFAFTAPNIPIVPLYMIFISGCCASGWACWTRRSFGLMANSVFLVTIDSIGLIRMLIIQ
jgi:hypothetical protein